MKDHLTYDTLDRPLRSLRVSVTDRCNLRCHYCMPEEDYRWLPRRDLLTFEETARMVGFFTELGVDKLRLTGGEPLLRKDVTTLVRMLSRNERLRDLALTTNGMLLAQSAGALHDAGLHRITVSLDTLRRDRFEALTRRNHLDKVLAGLQTARETGFEKIKLDCVIVRGTNEDELTDLIEFGRRLGAEIRFIEYMDVGGATRWSMDKVFSKAEMLKTLARRYGRIETIDEESWSPARRFVFADGAEEIAFGIIASTTEPFCRTCDRSRLTADGLWYLCLYARQGVDLREPLRRGASREEMLSIIQGRWTARTDRGAEQRQEMAFRQALVQPEGLRKDPHLEMHTRGG